MCYAIELSGEIFLEISNVEFIVFRKFHDASFFG